MRLVLCILASGLFAGAHAGQACSFGAAPTAEATRRDVAEALERAVILDAVVERAYTVINGTEEGPAILRALRIWKGPRQERFLVVAPTSCDVGFIERDVGRQVRVVLWGGPELYARRIVRQPRLYNRLLDRALRRMTPYTP